MSFWSSKKTEQLAQTEQDQITLIESRFKEFWNFLPLPVCEINKNGVVIDANQEFQKITEYNITGLRDKSLTRFFSEKNKIEEIISSVFTDKKSIKDQNFSILNYSKQLIPVKFYCNFIKESNTTLVCLISQGSLKEIQQGMEEQIKLRTKDIEESRAALLNMLEDTEEARARAEEAMVKTETIFSNFLDGLIVFNPNGQLELINARAEKFLGIKKDDYVGKTFPILRKDKRLKSLLEIVGDSMQSVFRKEFVANSDLILEVTSTFISIDERKLSFLIILHDISRERVIEDLKNQFVSVAAHQLRTPLSIIKWGLGMFLAGDIGKITKDQTVLLDKTYQTNERMIKLVNDLLNVSKIEEGRYLYQPKIVDMQELVQQVYDSSKEVAQRKKVEFKLNIKKSEKEKIVKIDIEKMGLAIKNIIDNAITYTLPGGKIEINLSRTGDKIDLVIKDTGVGIPEKQQERVFSKFFRAANVVKLETDGTGLGLFITRNVVEAHGGKISFKSKEGHGTTFFITLPATV